MAKRLLTKDFQNIVFETFSMPETDFYNYYLNTVEEHHSQNPRIIDGLKQVISGWVAWYYTKVYSGKLITVEHEDGTTETVDLNQTWEVDEKGNRTKTDLSIIGISLYHEFNINRHVNRDFFKNQLAILEKIQTGIELKHKIAEFEDMLPTIIKEVLAEYPQPTGFDSDELQNRVNLLRVVPYVIENLKPKLDQIEKRLTDAPHQITNPVAEKIFSSDQYKAFVNQIQQNGFYNVSINNQQVKVYTPELMVLFTSKDLALQNAHTDEKTTLNGRDYLETYAKGFNEGQQHFDSNFAANVNTLYGANAEHYVKDIHYNYFHKQHERNKDGWHYYKIYPPLLITHKEISKYGFYAGIISKVEELASKHPKPFETFENCEHKTEQPEPQATAKGKPVQTETLANNELQTILNSQNSLIDKVPIKEVYDHFEVLTEITNKFNEFYLTKEQLLIFIKATFIDLKPIKQKFNCSFIRKDIRKVFYKFYCNCMNKEPNQKNLKKKYFGILNNAFEGFNKNDFNDFHKI